MGALNCVVDGCWGSKAMKHRFPNPKKYLALCKKWIKLCGNNRVSQMTIDKVYINCRVCSLHFKPEDFGPNKVLLKSVFPTLQLPFLPGSESSTTILDPTKVLPCAILVHDYSLTSPDESHLKTVAEDIKTHHYVQMLNENAIAGPSGLQSTPKRRKLKQNDVGTHKLRTPKSRDTDCSKRWAYIRDYYIRKRGKPSTGSVGEAAKKRSVVLGFLDSCPSVKRRTVSNIKNVEQTRQSFQEDTDHIDAHYIFEIDNTEENSLSIQTQDTRSQNVCMPESEKSQICSTPSIARSTTHQSASLRSVKTRKASSNSEARLELLREIAHRPQQVQEVQDENDLFFASMAKIVKKLPGPEQVRLRLGIANMIGNAELALCNQNSNSNICFVSSGPSTSNSISESNDLDFLKTFQTLQLFTLLLLLFKLHLLTLKKYIAFVLVISAF